jgi:hypothetical protein
MGGVARFVSRVIIVPGENLLAVVLTNAKAGEAYD